MYVYIIYVDPLIMCNSDMRHRPDNNYKWIGHYTCMVWSIFHVIYSRNQTQFTESSLCLVAVFHSDNGRKLINEVVCNLVKEWSGSVARKTMQP